MGNNVYFKMDTTGEQKMNVCPQNTNLFKNLAK